jgi:MFS family permease
MISITLPCQSREEKTMPDTRDSEPHKLPPVVKATGFVSFFTDMGSEIIYPILPVFLTQLGASRAMIGSIEGLAEGLPAVIKLFSGALADRVRNRKWLILTGYALSTLFKPLVAFARSGLFVLVIRLLDRVGKGLRTAPRDALVADHTHPSIRGHAFGYQRAMDHAGALVGGLIGFGLLLWLGSDLPSLRKVIAWSFIPGILSVLTIVFFVREKPDHRPVATPVRNPLSGIRTLPRAYFMYIAAASAFALANSSDAFLLLRAQDMGVAVAFLPLLWSMLHLVKSTTAVWGGKLSDRIGRRPVLIAGWTLYAAVYAGFALFTNGWQAWSLFLAYGLFYGLTEGASRAVIADLIPAGQRGVAFGFWGMMEGLLLVAASILTGWLWDRTGSATLSFLFCGGMSLTGAILLLFLTHPHGKNQPLDAKGAP